MTTTTTTTITAGPSTLRPSRVSTPGAAPVPAAGVPSRSFRRPSAVERLLNRAFGVIVGLGGGLSHNRVLEVPGRRSGRPRRTPVNLMRWQGRQWLVAPRGRTGWVYNAEAHGLEVVLQRGRRRARYRLTPLSPAERAPVLREYLRRYARTVQGFFSVAPDATLDDFARVAARHPVFELTEIDA